MVTKCGTSIRLNITHNQKEQSTDSQKFLEGRVLFAMLSDDQGLAFMSGSLSKCSVNKWMNKVNPFIRLFLEDLYILKNGHIQS